MKTSVINHNSVRWKVIRLSRFLVISTAILLLIAIGGCGNDASPTGAAQSTIPTATLTPRQTTQDQSQSQKEGEETMDFKIISSAFSHGDSIPSKYSCDGNDISPSLQWDNAPSGTRSFALIMDDPDAPVGIWIHWVLYNIPAQTGTLPQAVASDATLPDGSCNGMNSWGRLGYGGPCPPGGTHRYFFKLYALDTNLELISGLNKSDLLKAIDGHILAEAELMGVYSR